MAPKGNTNAFKHGLYAKHFQEVETSQLRRMDPADYRHELTMLRLTIDRILLRLDQAADDDRRQGLWGSLLNAVERLDDLARTQAFLNGNPSEDLQSIEEAIRQFRQDEGIK